MNDIDWQEELKKWIVVAKKNESIFLGMKLAKETIRIIIN